MEICSHSFNNHLECFHIALRHPSLLSLKFSVNRNDKLFENGFASWTICIHQQIDIAFSNIKCQPTVFLNKFPHFKWLSHEVKHFVFNSTNNLLPKSYHWIYDIKAKIRKLDRSFPFKGEPYMNECFTIQIIKWNYVVHSICFLCIQHICSRTLIPYAM